MAYYITDIIRRYETDLQEVKQDGLALEFVKEQTHELCLVAVQQDGQALEIVKKQTPELCLAALLNKCDQLNTLSKAKRESEIKIKCVIKFI